MDNLCWVSPADEKGNVDNLLTRVSRLEEIIALLTGSNINALQLSDITPRAGVVTDFTALTGEGWITDGTYTGVGFSTLGWMMNDSRYPFVQMVDGVLQYGFNQAGGISGSSSSVTASRLIGSGSGSSQSLTGSYVNYPISQDFAGGTFTFPRQGYYLICARAHVNSAAAPGSDRNAAATTTTNGATGHPILAEAYPSGLYVGERAGGISFVQAGPAGTAIGIQVIGTLSSTIDCSLAIIQLATV